MQPNSTVVNEGREWIDLPTEMCRLIFDRLDVFGILSVSLVCRPWADVYAENRRIQPGTPILLNSHCNAGIEDSYQRDLLLSTSCQLTRF